MKVLKTGLVSFCLVVVFFANAQAQHSFEARIKSLSEVDSESSVIELTKIWDSLYFGPGKSGMYQLLPEEQWQKYFEKRITNQLTLSTKVNLAFALAAIYHTQSKFLKSRPLLEWLLKEKRLLSEKKYHLVLIKLEENYRGLFMFEKALNIRRQRVNLNLIKNYWALYLDCGLYELALQDFTMFEQEPSKKEYDYIKYLSTKANLYLGANKITAARQYFIEGLTAAKVFYSSNKNRQLYPVLGNQHWVGVFELGIARCLFKDNHLDSSFLIATEAAKKLSAHYRVESWFLISEILLKKQKAPDVKNYIDSIQSYTSIVENNYVAKLNFERIKRDYYKLVNNKELYQFYALGVAQDELLKSNAAISIYKDKVVQNLSDLELSQRRNELQRSYAIIKYQTLGIVAMIVGFLLLSLFLAFLVNKAKVRKKFAFITALKNEELEQKSKELMRQTEYAQWLLKELHHRVKNNLQVVSSMLSLQQRRTNTPEIASSLQSLQTRIQSIAIMHQHLYQDNEGSILDMVAYIDNLITQLKSSYFGIAPKVRFHTDISDCKLDISVAMPIGLIITEVVSNSLKHAFPDAHGNIWIKLKEVDDDFELSIQDDGRGFSQQQFGDDHLGLRLIQILTKQIKGTISIVSDNGVNYSINFKP